jgi:hypothetical protein
MTKDSWTEQGELKGEGLKYDQGKPDYSLLPPQPLEDLVRIYDYGVAKYARNNYLKGIKYSRIFAAIMRHLWSWWRGTEIDKESGLRHLAHAAWGCFTLLEFTHRGTFTPFDDRLKYDGCDHRWQWSSQRSDSLGIHITKICTRCGMSAIEVLSPPSLTTSIPSVWVPIPDGSVVEATITTSVQDDSIMYVLNIKDI